MTSTRHSMGNLTLTPHQQSLLFAALNANKPTNSPTIQSQYDGSPVAGADGQGSFQGSPDFDYDYDFAGADSSFDFSYDDTNQPRMIGDMPGAKRSKSGSADTESSEKRSHPDDDDDEENSGSKRRESEDKVAKKPGRKPLTTEPSNKRKAQNRAAQRAFRERKERHLKDLEDKVQELEKISESANNENEVLRAQVDKLTVELNEFRKRLTSLPAAGRPARQPPAPPFGSLFVNNLNDVNFQFEFPKFGALPGPPVTHDAKKSSTGPTRNSTDYRSPSELSQDGISPSNSGSYSRIGLDPQSKEDLANLSSGLFTPPLSNGNATGSSTVSIDSPYNQCGATATSSPSASSHSNMGGPSSSCGTSPEPYTQSPMGFKPLDTLATIGEEQPSLGNAAQDLGHFASTGIEDFTQWLPQQDFQFDPHLFGDYRDPQESVLSHGFDDSFFNDALDVDFTTPYNLPITTPAAPKKDLLAQIDAAKDADEVTPGGQLLSCTKVWERLQNCPKVQMGDFDLDGLCSDLQQKAKCDGHSAVVNEQDFDLVIKKYLCKDGESKTHTANGAATHSQS